MVRSDSNRVVPPTVVEYVQALKKSAKYGPQVVHHHILEAQKGEFSQALPVLHPSLLHHLKRNGIDCLYSHQEDAIRSINNGDDVIVATPTASGKTFIYNLPVLNAIAQGDGATALYLFPLKALARDQFDTLLDLFSALPSELKEQFRTPAAIFDGDTSPYQRQKIRKTQPPILLTNPEMLHLSLLPYHHHWVKFFQNLKYVVLDEVHTYRGVLGSHMAWVLRRLIRIAAYYGAAPQFIMLSATIGNPQELGQELLGRTVTVIKNSGSPCPEKNILFVNPWDSPAFTACQLLEASVKRGLRTIVYTQSRKMTELINIWTTPQLGKLSEKISAYRAGFLAEERRDIEQKLFSGELLGVISTSALELGIDIGDLDICILVGYPGSIMATMQRGGRVGRANKPSAIILIAQEDALDQYFMRRPDDFFNRSPESAILNPANETIMDQHLHCAASEFELQHNEPLCQLPHVQQALVRLAEHAILLQNSEGTFWYPTRKYPQRLVSLRGGGTQMSIINSESGEIIGEIDSSRAQKECHPEAVYLHRGSTWQVTSLNFEAKEVIAEQKRPHFYTKTLSEKDTVITTELTTKECFGSVISYGKVRVTERVTSFQKINKSTHKILATIPLALPEEEFETDGIWLTIPRLIKDDMEGQQLHFMGAIHAMEHVMIALFPLFVLCDRNDIGGISTQFHEQTEKATIFIYDGYAGGVGLSKIAYGAIKELLVQAEKVVESCECETGCPSCVHSPKCGSGNRPIDKKACLYLLKAILNSSCHIEPKVVTNVQPLLVPSKGLNSLPARYGVFDLETQRSAEDVGGWHNVDQMKMSLAVVYDSYLGEYITYLEDEVEELVEHLCSLDLVVGFNNIKFDNQVLAGYGHTRHHNIPTLDILLEVHERLGYRLSLDRLASATLGTKKSADGLMALQWYKEGQIDLIQKYCKKDVEITKEIFLFALEFEHLLFVNKGQKKVRLPLDFSSKITALNLSHVPRNKGELN